MSIFNFNKLRKEKKEKNKPNFNPFGTALQTVLNFFGKKKQEKKTETYEKMEGGEPGQREKALMKEFNLKVAQMQRQTENKDEKQASEPINLESDFSPEKIQGAFLTFLYEKDYCRSDLQDPIEFPSIVREFLVCTGIRKEVLWALNDCVVNVKKYKYKAKKPWETGEWDIDERAVGVEKKLPTDFYQVDSVAIHINSKKNKKTEIFDIKTSCNGRRLVKKFIETENRYRDVDEEVKNYPGMVGFAIEFQEDSRETVSPGKRRK